MNFILVIVSIISLSGPGYSMVQEKEYVYKFSDLEQCTTALTVLTRHSDARGECMSEAAHNSKVPAKEKVSVVPVSASHR